MSTKALQLVLDQRRERERAAANELAKSQSELTQFREQLKNLQRYRLQYVAQMQDKGVSGLKADSFGHYQSFVAKLEQAMVAQQSAVHGFVQNVETKKKHWIEQQTKRKAIESLLKKKELAKEKAELRVEQKMLDEFATFQFFKKRGEVE